MQKTNSFKNRYQANQAKYGDKKHVTQMNDLEKEFLMRKFRSVAKQDWTFTDYSMKRFNERGIDPSHFMSIFNEDTEVIEYHLKHGSNRILLRGKTVHNGAQVCMVVAPEQKMIITVYVNYHENQHEKLKLEFYDAGLNVLSAYRGGK